MKFFTLWLLLPLALLAQDPATLDAFRDQLNRISPNPVRDVSDADGRSRDALRAPLNADPNLSPAELQAAQTSLIRLNDRLNADAERAALQPGPAFGIAPIFLRSFPSPRPPAGSPNLALTKPTPGVMSISSNPQKSPKSASITAKSTPNAPVPSTTVPSSEPMANRFVSP